MAKKMLIDATHAEETRVVVVDGTKVEEFDFETVNKRQLAGNIYLAKVTRVEPSLQAAFVDYGGNRHGFLAFAEIHPDYYQIPAADRQALMEEERAYAEAQEAEETSRSNKRRGRRSEPKRQAEAQPETAGLTDAVSRSDDIPGMTVIDVTEADSLLESEAATDADEAVIATPGAAHEADLSETADQDDSGDDSNEASSVDEEFESVGDDTAEEIRPARKPRPRRYKIQEVIKVRQIMLVQVVKEERGNKGAALTTYLSLAGRYCVLMPNTARGGGISRKITNAADRKKLKDIASELEVPTGAGLIIRTAGSQRTRTEIRRDYEYLMRLWEQIRELTFKSTAPAPIYEEGDLIKRTIRDLYSKEIDEVLVEGERGYRTAKDFMRMIMPSHAKNVKHYADPMPLFARYQVESYLGGMFNPVVQLKSGGYIVIGVTEALVAIDVNSGRATKEGSIEETAFKTNCEAADEIARQLRLRDLAGLIVIDFIDMEERKNNAAVEKRFKERLKTDRARIQVGRISGFGLMEMSRQRLRPGMLESTTQPCPHCHGTGLIRSDDSLALTILRAIEEEGTRKRSREVLVRAPVAVANFLMNMKREHIAGIEARYGLSVRVEADPSLISPDYALEKFKTATRNVPELVSPVVSVDARLMAEIDEEDVVDEVDEAEESDEAPAAPQASRPDAEADGNGDNGSKKRRRRRRRRGGRGNGEAEGEVEGDEAEDLTDEAGDEATVAEVTEGAESEVSDEVAPAQEPAAPVKKPRARSRSRARKSDAATKTPAETPAQTEAMAEPAAMVDLRDKPAEVAAEAPVEEIAQIDAVAEATASASETPAQLHAEPVKAEPEVAETEVVEETLPVQEGEVAVDTPEPAAEPDAPARPKRRGWWSA